MVQRRDIWRGNHVGRFYPPLRRCLKRVGVTSDNFSIESNAKAPSSSPPFCFIWMLPVFMAGVSANFRAVAA
ncbi:hypothetical protein KCP75_17995 [Salmonella enterica subsp. enterica]|nr:hypothetical protein KCP75_17995 [Salmonella enterica subsp. enterica]